MKKSNTNISAYYLVKMSMVAWSNFVLLRTFFSFVSLPGDVSELGGGEDIGVEGLSRDEDVSGFDSEFPPCLEFPLVCTTKGLLVGGIDSGIVGFGGFFFL